MRRLPAVTLLVALAACASAADAGTPVKRLPPCSDSYLFVTETTPAPRFEAALLCLVNAARRTQHLPALHSNSALASVAQSQSDKFAQTGSASHGTTLADIGKRFE